MKTIAGSPNRSILILGGIHTSSLAVYAILSWGLNLVKPLSVPDQRIDFYRRVAESVPVLGRTLLGRLEGFDPLASPQVFLVGYCTPVVLSTLAFLALLVVLARARPALDPRSPQLVFRFGVAGALVCVFALPVLADDFWLSVVWGGMLAEGVNAYYVPMSEAFVAGTPFEVLNWKGNMTYGPVWAAISGAVMWLAGGRPLVGAILFKLLLAAGWIACLGMVRSILSNRSAWRQCLGLAIFGWLPVGVMQGVADGHNDVVVALFLLLWVYGLARARGVAASISLAASVAVKYVTAPLFLLDGLHHLRSRRGSVPGYVPRALAALALLAAGIVVFHGFREFFPHLSAMREWGYRFLTPLAAIVSVETLTGVRLVPLRLVAVALFPLLAVYLTLRYVRSPDDRSFLVAALATLCAVVFGVIGYLWPWYVLWFLAIAALVPGAGLTRWILGLALLVPFPVLTENAFPGTLSGWKAVVPAPLFYAATLAWFFLVPRAFLSEDEARTDERTTSP